MKNPFVSSIVWMFSVGNIQLECVIRFTFDVSEPTSKTLAYRLDPAEWLITQPIWRRGVIKKLKTYSYGELPQAVRKLTQLGITREEITRVLCSQNPEA